MKIFIYISFILCDRDFLFVSFKMKKLFKIIFLTTIFNSFTITALAQDNSTCFMLDSNGDPINLGYLCQSSSPKENPSNQQPQTYQPNSYNYQQPQTYQKGVYSIPIKSRRGGIPVIDVKFNDRHVFEMMLDTGASQIVITKQMAKTLRVQHHQNVWVSTPSNNRVAMSSGYLYSVSVADLYYDNPLVITAPTMDMGLLGQSFFSGYDMTIKSNVIEFRER